MSGRKTTIPWWKSPAWVASVLFHGVLAAVLLLVPGVLDPAPPATQVSRVQGVTPPEPLPAEPLPTPPPMPEPPPETPRPVPEDRVPVEAEAFPDRELTDPFNAPLPPAEMPPTFRSKPRKTIGAGGGAPAAPPPVSPAPVKQAPPRPTEPETLPVPERRPPPEYPRSAVRRNIQGRVVLLVEVLPDGSVGEIKVKESSGHLVLDRAAGKAVKEWHFRPAYGQGQPLRSWVEVPINFRLQD